MADMIFAAQQGSSFLRKLVFHNSFSFQIKMLKSDYSIYLIAIASISIRTSFGSLATSTQERAG